MTREIYHCLWIDSPPELVHRALTEVDGLAGWWTRGVTAEGPPPGVLHFRFQSGAFNRMRVELREPSRVQWVCVDGHAEWIGTHVLFELRPDDGRVKLCFAHYDWRAQTEYTGECSFHWARYLQSLKAFCETDRGAPNPG